MENVRPAFTVAEYHCVTCGGVAYADGDDIICIGCEKEEGSCACERLRWLDKVIVYHEVDEDGNHFYFFYDGNNKIELDWGETGFIPNFGDRFPHPDREIDLVLNGIYEG
jgi:hypothetical protein